MNLEQVTEKMDRLEHLEAHIASEERRVALLIRAHQEELAARLAEPRAEREVILRDLERHIRTQEQLGLGKRLVCPAGELRLTQTQPWRLGLGKRVTAQRLLELGLHRCLHVNIRASMLETLSEKIARDLEIVRGARLKFSYRLRVKP